MDGKGVNGKKDEVSATKGLLGRRGLEMILA
jgi:hypothetical protein